MEYEICYQPTHTHKQGLSSSLSSVVWMSFVQHDLYVFGEETLQGLPQRKLFVKLFGEEDKNSSLIMYSEMTSNLVR